MPAVMFCLALFPSSQISMNAARIKDELRISQIVLGHLMHSKMDRDERHAVYFLAIQNGKDPSPELLSRFAKVKWPVKAKSQSRVGDGPDFALYAYRDRVMGNIGAVLAIDEIVWVSPNEVTVDVSLASGGLYGKDYQYHLVKRNNEWFAKGRKLTGIS